MTSQQLAAAVARRRVEQEGAAAREQLTGGLAARDAGLRKPSEPLTFPVLPTRAARTKGRELVQHAVKTMVMRRKKRGWRLQLEQQQQQQVAGQGAQAGAAAGAQE
jgi:hypothetical protein